MADKANRFQHEEPTDEERRAAAEARNPVIKAAEEKLEAMEAGERIDIGRHQEIRQKHLGDGALTPEQRMTGVLGSENPTA